MAGIHLSAVKLKVLNIPEISRQFGLTVYLAVYVANFLY